MNLHTRICKGNDAGVLTELMLIFQYDILSDFYELRFDTYSLIDHLGIMPDMLVVLLS